MCGAVGSATARAEGIAVRIAVNRARGESEAAKPRTDWSNPTLPTLDDIKAAGATRLEARNSPGFRALANRLQLSGEYDANGGMYGVTR